MRILILGGTRFIGPHYVRAAVEHGHEVAVFNRGQTPAALPSPIERLIGDRNGDMESIRGRDWDAVIDLATFVPRWVRTLGQALEGRVGHYTFISTVAVYEASKTNGELHENSPVRAYPAGEDPYSVVDRTMNPHRYGALKVACEREAEARFPARTLVLRPGLIDGPHEDAQGYFAYWLLRMQHGGEVMVAGDPATPVQVIDVRDLAVSSIRLVEKHAKGIYNVVGPQSHTTLAQLIDTARQFAPAPSNVTWLPSSWLAAQKYRGMWGRVLYNTFESDGWAWSMQMNIDRASQDGLTCRPLSAMFADIHDAQARARTAQPAKLSWIEETTEAPGYALETIDWTTYLRREREILAAWHAGQSARKSS